MSKNVLILGGNGMIGHHLARKLKNEGCFVRTVDINEYEYGDVDYTNDYCIADLRDYEQLKGAYLKWDIKFDEVYNCAAWMGGAGMIFSGQFDAQILNDNIKIVLNICNLITELGWRIRPKLFHCSSACMYNHLNQLNPDNPGLKEGVDDYPAFPDSDYGWSKLIEERIIQAYGRNCNIDYRIARFHNIYGIEGAWNNSKEKLPAAACRKVAEAVEGGEVEVWGDGTATRSFLFIDSCIDAVLALMASDCKEILNIGSSEMVSVNQLVELAIKISGKSLTIKNVPTNVEGVKGRNSENSLIKEKLGFEPVFPLEKGMTILYGWVNEQVSHEMSQS